MNNIHIKHWLLLPALLLWAGVSGQEKTESDTTAVNYYQLQEVVIAGANSNSGLIHKVTTEQLADFNTFNVTEAVNLLPGVSISQFGARNEGTILVRGFNNLRTPVFYDGIPIYTPYDGNFDLSRFTTFDIESIAVDKGLVSVQYGPNAMGGAVNIVSRKPVKSLEANGQTGTGFADGAGVNSYFSSFNIGTRQAKFYALGSASFLKAENFVLSRKFEPTVLEDGEVLQEKGKRRNSEATDVKISAKAGYTPNTTDEYSLNFITQIAAKDISPKTSGQGNSNWRDYPTYNKTSLYAKTRTLLAPKTFLNATAYYDTYYNVMEQYDGASRTTINKNSSFSSVYDDYTLGAVVSASSEAIKNNAITFSINEKYDTHKEYNREIAQNDAIGQNFKAGEPVQVYRDNTVYAGLEDVITINSYLKGIAGASYSYRSNIKAQEYGRHYQTGEQNVLYDFPTGSDGAFDYKAGVIIAPRAGHTITASASRRSRFASQKERYSARFGTQVPNPDLKSEYAMIYDLTYSGKAGSKFTYELSGFINDIDDAIFSRTVGEQDNGDPLTQNVNIGRAVFQGIEAAFGYQLFKDLAIGANYSYIDMQDKTGDTQQKEKFTQVPNHKFIAYARIGFPAIGSSLNVNMETYGKRYITSDGSRQAPEFTLVNAKFSVSLTKNLALDLSVRNALDRNYYLSEGYYREGRAFITALSYTF